MSFFSGIGKFLGNLFGGNDDEEKKKRQQQNQDWQTPSKAPAPALSNVRQSVTNDQSQPVQRQQNQDQPDNKLNLVTFGGQQIPQDQLPALLKKRPDGSKESVVHELTHNPVTDIAGSVVKAPLQFVQDYSNTFANLAHKAAGKPQQTIEENLGTDPVSRNLLKVSGATGTNKQLAGSGAQVALTALAPGLDNLAVKAGSKVLPEATNKVVQTVLPKAVSGALVGSGFNAATAAGEGEDRQHVLSAAGQGGLLGGILGGAAGAIPLLRKAQSKAVEPTPGLRSVNPNQANDAAVQIAEQQPPAPLPEVDTPAYQRKPAQQAAQAADDAARLERERQLQITDPQNEVPAYQRQGKQLPSETPEAINSKLRENASTIAADPAMADAVNQSFTATGSQDPLSIIMHHLSTNPSKGEVRKVLSRLIPETDSNTFNRAVNEVVGAENPAEVAAALDHATMPNRKPFGALSDAPAAKPAEDVTPAPAVPTPDAPVVPDVPAVPSAPAPAIAAPEPKVSELVGDKTLPDNSNTRILPSGNKIVSWDTVSDDGSLNYSVEFKIGSNGKKTVTVLNKDEAGNVTGASNIGDYESVAKKYETSDPEEIAKRATISEIAAYDKSGNPVWRDKGTVINPKKQNTHVEGEIVRPGDLQAPMRSALNIPEPSAAAPSVDIAPRSHDQLVKQLGPAIEKDLKGNYSKKLPVNIEELKQNAIGAVANMSDEDLLRSFQTTDASTMITNSQDLSLARAALDRFSKMYDNPEAVQQVTNILDAMDRAKSRSGEILRLAQEEFDNMPPEMKVRYLIKKIDSANVETKGYEPLARDPERASVIEANLMGYLRGSQNISERIAGIENQLNAVAESAKNGERVTTDIKGLARTLQTERRNLASSNGDLVKYFQDLVPGRTKTQKALVDFPKRMMLSSFTGRINDLLTTSANITNLGAQNFTQGLLSKAVNIFKPGKVTDTLRGTSRIFSGGVEGLKKTAGEIKGNQYVDNLERSLRGNEDLRSGLRKANGPVGRTIQAATEAATNISEGVRDQRLYQLADQEAAQAGLTGSLRRQYAAARSAVPSRQMVEAANQLHLEVNNLNENPISRALNRVSASIEGKSAVGGFIKNQIMPFTSWLGGNIWNSVTDKNVIASVIKFARDAGTGNTEGAVRNLARTINGAVEAYAIGYSLSKAGIITNQNAEGYNDGGAYFHVGDRYIPVGFLGFFAPNIILGNAAYNGIENNNGQNPAEVIARNIVGNSWGSLNINGALGVDTSVSRALDAKDRPGGTWADAAAVATGSAAGQFVPALGGDANALLNNGLQIGGKTVISDVLNPTHEAADTKVVNPNSPSGHARDYPKSALASFKNRIPVLSQSLPRKANVAAPDAVDRVTRGDRDTTGGKNARAEAKAKVDQAADWKKRDIPNFQEKGFDDAVEARVQRGEYDKAIEGLNAKLEDQKKNKDIPDSKNKAINDQVKQLKVLKDGHFEPTIRDLYKSTSLSEWRNMGDPEKDTYDPKMYQKLFDYDSALAKSGISGSTLSKEDNKYTAKKPSTSSGKKSAADKAAKAALDKIKSNTIGNTPELSKITLGELTPQKAGSIKMPTIQKNRSSDVIKKRKITIDR